MVKALINGRKELTEDAYQHLLLSVKSIKAQNAGNYKTKVSHLGQLSRAFKQWSFDKEASETLIFARQVVDNITSPMIGLGESDHEKNASSRAYISLAREYSKHKNYEEAIDLYDAALNLNNRARVEKTERAVYLRKERLLTDIALLAHEKGNNTLLLQVTERVTHPFYKYLVKHLDDTVTAKDKLELSDVALHAHSKSDVLSLLPYLFWLVTEQVNNGDLVKAEEALSFIRRISNATTSNLFKLDTSDYVIISQAKIVWAYYYAHIGDIEKSRAYLDEAYEYAQKTSEENRDFIFSIIHEKKNNLVKR